MDTEKQIVPLPAVCLLITSLGYPALPGMIQMRFLKILGLMFNMMTKVCWDSERLNLFESGRNLFKSSTKIYYSWGGHHSFVVSSAPTILRPRVRIPSTPSMLFSIYIVEIETLFLIWNEKWDENERKRGQGWPIFRKWYFTPKRFLGTTI